MKHISYDVERTLVELERLWERPPPANENAVSGADGAKKQRDILKNPSGAHRNRRRTFRQQIRARRQRSRVREAAENLFKRVTVVTYKHPRRASAQRELEASMVAEALNAD